MILTFTANPAIDASTTVGQVIADRKLHCTRPRYDPGGGGLNVARVIRRLGGDATAVFLAGGPTGMLLRELLGREGVPHEVIETKGWTRENLTVLEESSGRQFRFGMPGAELAADEWNDALAVLRQRTPAPAFIVASGSLPPGAPEEGYSLIAHIAVERGSKLVLDTSGAALARCSGPGVYLIKPNLRELAEVMGREIHDEAGAEEAAKSLVDRGASEVVVVSLGAGGALVVSRHERLRIVAPVVRVRSRVGAGDSMVGAMVCALAQKWSLEQSVRYGVAAGTAAVMRPGTELCHREDVERLFAAMSGRSE